MMKRPIPIREITAMADLSVSMLHRALGAFIAEDVETARSLPLEDEQVDDLYKVVYHKLVQMHAALLKRYSLVQSPNYMYIYPV